MSARLISAGSWIQLHPIKFPDEHAGQYFGLSYLRTYLDLVWESNRIEYWPVTPLRSLVFWEDVTGCKSSRWSAGMSAVSCRAMATGQVATDAPHTNEWPQLAHKSPDVDCGWAACRENTLSVAARKEQWAGCCFRLKAGRDRVAPGKANKRSLNFSNFG